MISGNQKADGNDKVIAGQERQDYVVTPRQEWVDGFAVGSGQVRQFVATSTTIGFTSPSNLAAIRSNMSSDIQSKLN